MPRSVSPNADRAIDFKLENRISLAPRDGGYSSRIDHNGLSLKKINFSTAF
jgi:hypothetical protein